MTTSTESVRHVAAELAFAKIRIADRAPKPREVGITMIADFGLGLGAQADALELGSDYLDLAKIAVGVSRLLSPKLLRSKIDLYAKHGVQTFPGGQFLEYATHNDQVQVYLEEAVAAGYRMIEVSDNVIELTPQQKTGLIRSACESYGLRVIGEVGKKGQFSTLDHMVADIEECLEAGSWKVLVEAAELFGDELNEELIEALASRVPLEKLVFEVPGPWIPGTHRCDQHALRSFLVRKFGRNVNVGNVPAEDILEFETMRRGIGVAALRW